MTPSFITLFIYFLSLICDFADGNSLRIDFATNKTTSTSNKIAHQKGFTADVWNQTKTKTSKISSPSYDDHQDCVDSINNYRTKSGLQPLKRNVDQEVCVEWQADFDFQHPDPCCQYFEVCNEKNQVECIQWPNTYYITDCIDDFMSLPRYRSLRAVILGQYEYVACGYGGDGEKWTGTIDFW